MIPVDQQIMHDPDNGVYGDCMRACIASLLEVSLEQVPHFYRDGDEYFDFYLNQFLAENGLSAVSFNYFDITHAPKAVNGVTNIYYIVSGQTSRGTYHAVIGCNGEIVHDPHPSKTGLIGDESTWHIQFIIKPCC